jgi:hypothetical protein
MTSGCGSLFGPRAVETSSRASTPGVFSSLIEPLACDERQNAGSGWPLECAHCEGSRFIQDTVSHSLQRIPRTGALWDDRSGGPGGPGRTAARGTCTITYMSLRFW